MSKNRNIISSFKKTGNEDMTYSICHYIKLYFLKYLKRIIIKKQNDIAVPSWIPKQNPI